MRKLIIIGLLCIYTASQVGFLLVQVYRPVIHAISFYRQQQLLRHDPAIIKDTTISIQLFNACREGRNEILLNGVLHDIKHITYQNNQVRLQLLEDKNETHWLGTFSIFTYALKQQQQSSGEWYSQILKWLTNIYCNAKAFNQLIPAEVRLTSFPGMNPISLSDLSLDYPGQPPDHLI